MQGGRGIAIDRDAPHVSTRAGATALRAVGRRRTGLASRRVAGSPRGGFWRCVRSFDAAAVATLSAAAAALYIVFALGEHRHFFTSAYDLGIFDQAVRSYAHLGAPVSLIKGVHNNFGTHFSVLGDHFSPILALLAPFYRVFPHVQTLLIAQGVLFAASIPSVWLFTRRNLGKAPAYLIAVAYALSWSLQTALSNDFHEIAFAVPLLAVAIERLDAGKLRTAIVAALLLLLVKEDLGVVVAAFGVVIALRTKRWRTGAILAVGGLVAAFVETRLLIPAAGGRSGYYWTYYADLGSSPLSAVWHVIRHPLSTWHFATSPEAKARLLKWLFLPLGLASLGSSFVLLAIPPIAEVVLSSNPYDWPLDSHYTAVVAPILTMAAVDTVAKLRRVIAGAPAVAMARRTQRRRSRAGWVLGASWATVVVVIAVWGCGRMPFDQMTKSWWSKTSTFEQAENAAVAAVPSGATVEVSDHLAPHLTDRANVMLLDTKPHNASWVVIDEGYVDWPLTPAEQQARVSWLGSHGYQVVFARSQIVVYHREQQ
ncbi:MAG: DUF2079 domain-containing protein [Acidothermaceae bacterium]